MAESTAPTSEDVPVVGRREPCPCGAGKRYKECHGKKRRGAAAQPVNRRTFEGLPGECDLVAMREIVPAASARVTATKEYGGKEFDLVTLLPMVLQGLARIDGERFVALQVMTSSVDVSRDLGAAAKAVLEAEPGTPIQGLSTEGDRPRLQDIIDSDAGLKVTVHDTFDFWAADEQREEMAAGIKQATDAIIPTDRLLEVDAAYWCRIGDREHLRWVLPEDEEKVLDALARLQAEQKNNLGEGSKFLGAFRAHGLVAPVWDLPSGWTSEDTEDPAKQWLQRYHDALADTSELTSDQRRARAGIVSRQLTLH